MPGYQYSSSPPATPNRSINSAFSLGASNNPSTTPAGPPPSSVGSFTPAGPPPSSYNGSTMQSPTPNESFSYSQQSAFGLSELQSPNFSSPVYARPAPRAQRPLFGKNAPSQRKARSPSLESEEEEEEEEAEDEEEEEDTGYPDAQTRRRYADLYSDGEDDEMEDEDGRYEDEEMDDYRSESRGTKSNRNVFDQHSNSVRTSGTPNRLRQSKGNQLVEFRGSLARSRSDKPKASEFARIARDLSSGLGVPAVDEGDDLILKTEAIITKLYEEGVGKTDNEEMLQRALALIPSELTALWKEYDQRNAAYNGQEYTATIGPGPGASEFSKANYLAHLALQIHHSKPMEKGFQTVVKPLPQIMLEWLDECHNPFPNQIHEMQMTRPSPAASHVFWNIVFNSLLRGKVVAVVHSLQNAGWKFAWSGTQDINDQGGESGYSGAALVNVEKVINDATTVLSLCPAVNGDWDIRGGDWTLFRLRISQALEDLKHFAEGDGRASAFEPEGFNNSSMRSSRGGNYSKLAKKAASRVPWNIYQHLVTLYNIVLGDSTAIIENAQDWCEATIALLVWRDEGQDDRRLAPGRSINSLRASVIDYESDNDLRKLQRAFGKATGEDTDFHVNSMDLVEVGLACLFEGDSEALISILRAWSGPVSSALAEVASLAGWLPRAEPQELLMGPEPELDGQDLAVLGAYGNPSKMDGAKDLTLITYAKSLLQIEGVLHATVGQNEIAREGWELAIAVLGRLDSTQRSEEMVEEIVKTVRLDSAGTVDKLWRLLNDLGMSQYAETTALSYANSLARDTFRYGEALWYYALAHDSIKVKDVLDTLIVSCLMYSTAFPSESELDDHLRRLLSSPKNALNEMSSMDVEAAELVHTSLSGYATLRRFYTLRDEEVMLSPGSKPSMGAIARKAEAANALLAVITSSDDNIRGGLYDQDCGAVVGVDYILALLGEAMSFVNQPDFLLTTPQIDVLLRTIEDIEGVGPRIYSACSDFLQAVITNTSGLKGSTPNDLLRKSTSGLSGSSGSFSMVGSSMVASQFQRSVASSGVLIKGNIKRGWDWRRNLKAGTTDKDILRILRLGLAKDLARSWLGEVDCLI